MLESPLAGAFVELHTKYSTEIPYYLYTRITNKNQISYYSNEH